MFDDMSFSCGVLCSSRGDIARNVGIAKKVFRKTMESEAASIW